MHCDFSRLLAVPCFSLFRAHETTSERARFEFIYLFSSFIFYVLAIYFIVLFVTRKFYYHLIIVMVAITSIIKANELHS